MYIFLVVFMQKNLKIFVRCVLGYWTRKEIFTSISPLLSYLMSLVMKSTTDNTLVEMFRGNLGPQSKKYTNSHTIWLKRNLSKSNSKLHTVQTMYLLLSESCYLIWRAAQISSSSSGLVVLLSMTTLWYCYTLSRGQSYFVRLIARSWLNAMLRAQWRPLTASSNTAL